MNKEKYMTPNAEMIAIEESDVITTSPIDKTDELLGLNTETLDPSDPLYKLF